MTAATQLESCAGRLTQIEVSYEELESAVDRRFEEIRAAAAAAGPAGAGGFTGANFHGVPSAERVRNVFNPRDYKLEALPATLSFGAWKKWKYELEIYLDTIRPSWRGVKLSCSGHATWPCLLSPFGRA